MDSVSASVPLYTLNLVARNKAEIAVQVWLPMPEWNGSESSYDDDITRFKCVFLTFTRFSKKKTEGKKIEKKM